MYSVAVRPIALCFGKGPRRFQLQLVGWSFLSHILTSEPHTSALGLALLGAIKHLLQRTYPTLSR